MAHCNGKTEMFYMGRSLNIIYTWRIFLFLRLITGGYFFFCILEMEWGISTNGHNYGDMIGTYWGYFWWVWGYGIECKMIWRNLIMGCKGSPISYLRLGWRSFISANRIAGFSSEDDHYFFGHWHHQFSTLRWNVAGTFPNHGGFVRKIIELNGGFSSKPCLMTAWRGFSLPRHSPTFPSDGLEIYRFCQWIDLGKPEKIEQYDSGWCFGTWILFFPSYWE